MLNSRSKSCFAPCTHSSGSLDTKRSSTLSGSWSSSGQSWLKYAPRNCARSGKSSLVKAVRIPYESDNRRETADFSSIQGERRLRLEGFQLGEISSNWLRELGGNFNTGFVAKQSVGDLRLISSDRSEGSPLGCRSVIERGGPRSRFVRGGTRRQLPAGDAGVGGRASRDRTKPIVRYIAPPIAIAHQRLPPTSASTTRATPITEANRCRRSGRAARSCCSVPKSSTDGPAIELDADAR